MTKKSTTPPSGEARHPLHEFLPSWRPYALVALLAVLVYSPSLNDEFIDLDDRLLIVRNREFLEDPGNVVQAFRQNFFKVSGYEDRATYYRPVVVLSYMFDMMRGGTAPKAYHWTNVLLHALCAALLFRLLWKLGVGRGLSLVLALAFAVHPAFAQVVTWVPGRNDALLGVFALLSLLGLMAFRERGRPGALAAHGLGLLLALFTKEAAVALFPLFVLYLVSAADRREAFDLRRALTLGTIWVGAGAVWFALRSAAVELLPVEYVVVSILANISQLLVLTGKALLPVGLSVYPLKQHSSLVPGAVALVVLAGLLVVGWRFRSPRNLLFGGCWFVVFLVPTLVLDRPWDRAVFYEHRLYLPVIGILILLKGTGGLDRLARLRPAVGGIATAAMLSLLIPLTLIHQGHFGSRRAFWENAVATSPGSAVAHMNLGVEHAMSGRLDEAETSLRRALEIDPTQESAHLNLGILYRDRKMPAKAREMFQMELEVNPGNPKAHFNLGVYAAQAGRIREAVDAWEKAVAHDPGYLEAYELLAVAACERKEFEEARRYLREIQVRGGRVGSYAAEKLKPYQRILVPPR